MASISIAEPEFARRQRQRCYGCFRPRGDCFCHAIPTIDNRTEVLILQHVRERFHPFNTARIVHRALTKSTLLVDQTARLAARLELPSGAGLLYPCAGARPLEELPAPERPRQLIVIDGTWHHAKTLVRDIPALARLPRYGLAPAEPSRYRIRREPNATALSTVEATVAALRVLEPETRGLDQLLAAFNMMVEGQLAHPKSVVGWRCHQRRLRTVANIPVALVSDLHNVVVAYGESTTRSREAANQPRAPLYWVAERLGTGERFAARIAPVGLLSDTLLGHLELAREDFVQAMSLASARRAWAEFLRPGDVLAVYNQSAAALHDVLAPGARCLVLKGVDWEWLPACQTLDDLVAAAGLLVGPPQLPGRAGKRLANVVALARYLHDCGVAAVDS